jgi:TfoX/Sxy family transcriptional regulator of competence genes
MAYNEHLAERISILLKEKHIVFEEKKMMGGLCYMVEDKMCLGVVKNNLMARVDPSIYEEMLQKDGAGVMDFTGRPMKGYLFIRPEGTDLEKDLEYWVSLCLEFNPRAKSSKGKKS